MSSLKAGLVQALPFFFNQTDLLAGTTQEIIAPFDGYITELQTIVQTAITTGGDITVAHGDALATTVAGISITVPDAAAKGARQSEASTAGSSTRAVSKGDRIGILASAGFATAGAVGGNLIIAEADVSPALPAA